MEPNQRKRNMVDWEFLRPLPDPASLLEALPWLSISLRFSLSFRPLNHAHIGISPVLMDTRVYVSSWIVACSYGLIHSRHSELTLSCSNLLWHGPRAAFSTSISLWPMKIKLLKAIDCCWWPKGYHYLLKRQTLSSFLSRGEGNEKKWELHRWWV